MEVCVVESCIWTHLSQQVTVEHLKHFIEAKLAESLHGVADEGGGPALCQSPDTIFPHCQSEAVTDALELFWVHLRKRIQSDEACHHGGQFLDLEFDAV